MVKKRVFRAPLHSEWAEALLSGDLEEARLRYRVALNEARLQLASHPLAPVVAEAAARKLGRRGTLDLIIDDMGTVLLEVQYGKPKPKFKSGPRSKSKLPPITKLRAEAEQLGINVSDLGKAKRKILARIETFKSQAAPKLKPQVAPKPTPKPKMVKTAPALTPPEIMPSEVLTLTGTGLESLKPLPLDLATIAEAGSKIDMKALLSSDEKEGG